MMADSRMFPVILDLLSGDDFNELTLLDLVRSIFCGELYTLGGFGGELGGSGASGCFLCGDSPAMSLSAFAAEAIFLIPFLYFFFLDLLLFLVETPLFELYRV